MVKEILLTNSDEFVLVDDEDYDYLNQWNWQLHITSTGRNIQRTQRVGNLLYSIIMSREVAKIIKLDLINEIDHIDRNPLNNQRDNLRSATRSLNIINSALRKDNSTGYKGVTFNYENQKYRARICVDQKQLHIGYFNEPEDAAKAYDRAAKYYFGDYAWLNFP